MPDDLLIDDAEAQLRHYGRWLEERSNVVLSPDGERGGDTEQMNEPNRGSAARRAMMVSAVAVVLVVMVVTGLAVVGYGDGDTVTSATDDGAGPQDDGEASQTVLSVDGVDGAEAPDGTEGAEGAEGADKADDVNSATGDQNEQSVDGAIAGDAPVAGEESDGGESADDVEPTTPTTASPASDAESPTSSSSPTPESPELAPVPMFTAPRVGSMIDRNLNNGFSVTPIDGAVSYTFVGSQDGVEIFRFSETTPGFTLPSRLTSNGAWPVEPGLLTVTVAATDQSGAMLSTGTITVMVRPENLPPRFGPTTP